MEKKIHIDSDDIAGNRAANLASLVSPLSRFDGSNTEETCHDIRCTILSDLLVKHACLTGTTPSLGFSLSGRDARPHKYRARMATI